MTQPHEGSSVWGRLRYAVHQRRRPRTLAGWLRLAWHDFIVHALCDRGGERCQDCGRDYPLWRAPDKLYKLTILSDGGLFCPACFSDRAEAKGFHIRFMAERYR
jgi:hypothetical protein